MRERDRERLARRISKLDFDEAPALEIIGIYERLGLSQRHAAGLLGVTQPAFNFWKSGRYPMPTLARRLSRHVLADEVEKLGVGLAPDGTD